MASRRPSVRFDFPQGAHALFQSADGSREGDDDSGAVRQSSAPAAAHRGGAAAEAARSPRQSVLRAWGAHDGGDADDASDDDDADRWAYGGSNDWFCPKCTFRNVVDAQHCDGCNEQHNPFWHNRNRLRQKCEERAALAAANTQSVRVERAAFLASAKGDLDDLDDLDSDCDDAAAQSGQPPPAAVDGRAALDSRAASDGRSPDQRRSEACAADASRGKRARASPSDARHAGLNALPAELLARVLSYLARVAAADKAGLRAAACSFVRAGEADALWDDAVVEAVRPAAPGAAAAPAAPAAAFYTRVVLQNDQSRAAVFDAPVLARLGPRSGASAVYFDKRMRARSAAREGRWGCLASGWRWLQRSALGTLLLEAVEEDVSRPLPSVYELADARRISEAAADLGDEQGAAACRANAPTAFERMDFGSQTAWSKAVAACCRRDAPLLADCFALLAHDVAELLSRSQVGETGGGDSDGAAVDAFLAKLRVFERWVSAVERGCDELEQRTDAARQRLHAHVDGAQADRDAPSLRRRCFDAFRRAALFGVRGADRRPVARLEAAIVRSLYGGAARALDSCRTLTGAELRVDKNFEWSALRLCRGLGRGESGPRLERTFLAYFKPLLDARARAPRRAAEGPRCAAEGPRRGSPDRGPLSHGPAAPRLPRPTRPPRRSRTSTAPTSPARRRSAPTSARGCCSREAHFL